MNRIEKLLIFLDRSQILLRKLLPKFFGFGQVHPIAIIRQDFINTHKFLFTLSLSNANLLIGDKLPQRSIEVLHFLQLPHLLPL